MGTALVQFRSGKTPIRALLAHDGRRSGPSLEAALARGLSAAGIESESAGLLPTPGLAWLTRHEDYSLGIMVSASHNPAQDNGIKVFNGQGDKLADQVQSQIEALLHGPSGEVTFPETPRPKHNPSLEAHYLKHLERTWGRDLDLNSMTIVVDCANGAGSRSGPKALGRLGAKVHAIADEPDGENINKDCGSTHPEALIAAVRTRKADVGIALDGDGDRCLLVDELGNLVDGDAILMILALQAQAQKEFRDPRIVATVMSNRGLHRALRDAKVGVIEVGVGDRNVVEALRKENLDIGGEQSGHVILGQRNDFIGDGMVTALAVLRVVKATGKTLSELTAPFKSMPQILLGVRVDSKPALDTIAGLTQLLDACTEELGDDGRVLLRYSGTENLARVMVEGLDAKRIRTQAEELAHVIREAIGSR
ncbi:MAG: phosphoglucosamine mutase [Planctomycetes bacterium]|nr:phosphoglucosamine mutase [Planctomycetota bacterium]